GTASVCAACRRAADSKRILGAAANDFGATEKLRPSCAAATHAATEAERKRQIASLRVIISNNVLPLRIERARYDHSNALAGSIFETTMIQADDLSPGTTCQ